jgi:hypothetical protein
MTMPDEITLKDKLDVLRNEKLLREAGTYHEIASADADQDRGGRFSGLTRPSVIGSSPISYPQMPENNPWRCDPVPPEMPLGYAINDQEATGEKWEQQRSIEKASSSARDDASASPVRKAAGDATEPTSSVASATAGDVGKFRRRL